MRAERVEEAASDPRQVPPRFLGAVSDRLSLPPPASSSFFNQAGERHSQHKGCRGSGILGPSWGFLAWSPKYDPYLSLPWPSVKGWTLPLLQGPHLGPGPWPNISPIT